MSTELQTTEPVAVADVAEDVQLIARSPGEMRVAQQSLVAWANAKVAILDKDIEELAENVAIAKQNGWKVDTLQRHHGIAVKRRDYYDKIRLAVEAGYCIVPNFPVDIFAVRTKRTKPLEKLGGWRENRDERPTGTPANVGEYKNPSVIEERYEDEYTNSKGEKCERTMGYATAFQDEIEFPISVAKPLIMSETAAAMALKVFDEMGILPSRIDHGASVKGDPIVIGRIVMRYGYTVKQCSFLIAWYVDTKDL